MARALRRLDASLGPYWAPVPMEDAPDADDASEVNGKGRRKKFLTACSAASFGRITRRMVKDASSRGDLNLAAKAANVLQATAEAIMTKFAKVNSKSESVYYIQCNKHFCQYVSQDSLLEKEKFT